jgi:hypothetical protein
MNKDQQRWIRRVFARAAPLWSRKSTLAATERTGSAGKRLERWRAVLGSDKLLDRRMRAHPGETPLTLLARTAPSRPERWTRTLGAILFDTSPDELPQNHKQRVPFGEIFDVFLRHAETRLQVEAGRSLRVLCPSAMASFERDLLEHLTFVANLVIGKAFYDFRFERAPMAAFEECWSTLPPSQDIYCAFVRQMRFGGLVELLEQYPVLARLLAQSVDQWISAVGQFCRRCESAFAQLVSLFQLRYTTCEAAVESVDSRLSAPLRRGARSPERACAWVGIRRVLPPHSA